MQIAISIKLNTWNTWFAGKEIQCGSSFLGACTHGDLLAEQGEPTLRTNQYTSFYGYIYCSLNNYLLSLQNNNCHECWY